MRSTRKISIFSHVKTARNRIKTGLKEDSHQVVGLIDTRSDGGIPGDTVGHSYGIQQISAKAEKN